MPRPTPVQELSITSRWSRFFLKYCPEIYGRFSHLFIVVAFIFLPNMTLWLDWMTLTPKPRMMTWLMRI